MIQIQLAYRYEFVSDMSRERPDEKKVTDNHERNRKSKGKGGDKGSVAVWEERKEAEASLERYLGDLPNPLISAKHPRPSPLPQS